MKSFEGYPRDNGATDMMDSARLAGILATIGSPDAPPLSLYVNIKGECVRCPISSVGDEASDPSNFSRDQLLCLTAGLYAQKRYDIAWTIYCAHRDRDWRCQNGDWLSPSHRLHLKICANLPELVTRWERLWLSADIFWATKIRPFTESNQLLCQLITAGAVYVSKYCHAHPHWKGPIISYWCNWRSEGDLALAIIDFVQRKLNETV